MLFICIKGNWDDQQIMHMVKFDPISEEKYEDHRDLGEPARPPEKRVSELPTSEESPVYKVRGAIQFSSPVRRRFGYMGSRSCA